MSKKTLTKINFVFEISWLDGIKTSQLFYLTPKLIGYYGRNGLTFLLTIYYNLLDIKICCCFVLSGQSLRNLVKLLLFISHSIIKLQSLQKLTFCKLQKHVIFHLWGCFLPHFDQKLWKLDDRIWPFWLLNLRISKPQVGNPGFLGQPNLW